MKYSDNFDEFYTILIETLYTGPRALDELKLLIDGIIAFMDLTSNKDEQFAKSIAFYRRHFEIDLGIVQKGIKSKGLKSKEDYFYEAKKQLKIDIKQASSRFVNW